MPRLIIHGAAGRMGRRLIALAAETKDLHLVAAVDAQEIGSDSGQLAGLGPNNIKITPEFNTPADVVIDFSLPAGTEKAARWCKETKTALVVGTTGLGRQQLDILDDLANHAPVLLGANMSLGVNLLFKLVAQVAAALPDSYDIELVETHHRFKRDAPSGTALELARQMAKAKDWPFPDCLTHGRHGNEALRQDKTIGIHAVRSGDVVGEHSVTFTTLGEQIEIRHRAHTRDTFVRGALQAATFLATQKPGHYTMPNVLGL